MEAEVTEQFCPICGTAVRPYLRYPAYVCSSCVGEAVSADGRLLSFSNTEFLGHGFVATFRDSGEVYDSDICFIRGRKCRGEEAYFGGIVVQPTDA